MRWYSAVILRNFGSLGSFFFFFFLFNSLAHLKQAHLHISAAHSTHPFLRERQIEFGVMPPFNLRALGRAAGVARRRELVRLAPPRTQARQHHPSVSQTARDIILILTFECMRQPCICCCPCCCLLQHSMRLLRLGMKRPDYGWIRPRLDFPEWLASTTCCWA